jgi:hypothetical protein
MQRYTKEQSMGKILLWETEFFAVSTITGETNSYRGIFIQADTINNAIKHIRGMGMDYLQVTGTSFNSFEEILATDIFYNKLTNPKNIVKDMSYDEFMDWLELAVTKDDLLAAKRAFEKEGGLEDHIKIIDLHIKLKYGKDNEEDNEEDTEEVG